MKKTMMQICAAVAAAFIAVKQAYAVAALSSIDDVRVGPLLTTSWAQGSVGSAYCYNYYTPLHRACGCTATAVGQIMYYHRYPTTRILPGETLYDTIDEYGSYSIGTDGNGGMTKSSDGTYTAFDPPYGGPYNWNLMVASPTSATSENSRKAIGQLTRDAGFAVFSHYYTGETSGYTAAVASSIILNLHYADAVRTGFDLNKLIANLDAGLPVEVGITSHAVVADGYGYHNGTLYIHINYGHGGSNSGWYDPTSTIGSGDRSLQDMVANIFPPSRGARHSSVISGRVLDANGNPVANATVTASADGLSTVTTNSNAHGVYAFILPAGDYTFAVSKSGAVGSRAYTVAASSQKTRAEGDGWGNGVNNSASGIDVTLYSESDFAKSWRNNAGDGRFDNAQNWTGNTLPSSGQDVAVFVSGDTVITASSAMTVGTVSVPSGTVRFSGSGSVITLGGVNLLSAASTVEITGREGLADGGITGVGTLVINPGAGNTYTMPNNNTNFTGEAVIKSGTVKFGNSRSFGAQPSNIRVKGGATLDENNVTQGGYSGQKNYLTLEEGATLAASSGNVTTGSPLTKMKLEGNATVDATSGTVSIADGFDYLKMEIKLGANTLTKIGSKDFYISCCEISGTGLFDVTEGRVVMAPMYFTDNSPASCSEGTMRIRSGASIHINDNNNKVMVLTVKDLILDGSVTKGNCNHVLTVTGSITGSGTTPMLTLGSDAVFKPNGTGCLTVTESLSGTFRLDMSGVDLSSTNEVPLVSVPSALAGSVSFDSTTIPAGWTMWPVPENGNVRYVLTNDDHLAVREMFHTDLLGRFAKRAEDFDVGDYVQTGLIAHYDGIRNAGADLPHDPTTRTWKNLVSGAPDATFVGEGGEWNAAGNGFVFDGSTVRADMDSPGVDMNHVNSTVQIACDVDYTQQSNGGGWYPGIFVMTDQDYGIFYNNTGSKSNVLNYKPWPYSNNDGGQRPTISPWDGKYVTAAFDGYRQYLVEGTSLGEGKPRSSYSDQGTKRFAWGGNPQGATRYVKGTYHSVRIYNATLTEAQLAQNWYIDEMRFRGAFTADDVDIVIATNQEGIEGVEPSGEYMVNGSHTFSAANVWVGDNEWAPTGYTLKKWNGSEWTPVATSTDTSFAYTNCLANGKMLLTWNFEQHAVQGARLVHRWSFTSDYSDSVGGSTGTAIGSALAITDGEVVMSGNGNSTGSLNLGTGIMPSTDATIEIWATRTGVKNWARVLDIGSSTTDYFIMTWVNGSNGSGEKVILKKNNVDNESVNTMLYADNVKYHISVTFKANGDGSTTVTWARRNTETGAVEKSASKTYSGWTLANLSAGNFYIGHSQWSGDYDANAKYDEVRIWNGVVGDDQLAANAMMGPDVYTVGFEEGFVLASNAVFNIPADGYAASGDVVLGAGSKLRFDTSSMHYDEPVSFSATGFNIPSGSILDYVEPQDSANFSVTLSENTITVTRLRQNEPDAYLEFVATTGAQYFDLGFEGYSTMTFEADIDWVSGTYFAGSTWNETYPLKNAGGKIGGELLGSGTATSSVALDTGRHTVVSRGVHGSRLSIMVDGVEVTSSSNCGSKKPKTGQTMLLFAAKNNVSTEANFSGRLYSLNISTNGVMARQFVPGIKNYVAGLYDRLNDAWYVSGSGTELIPGPVKERHNEPQVYLDYVKSTGAQWVETKFMPSRTMTVEADLDWISGVVLSQNHYDIRVLSPNNGCIAGSTYSYSSYATTDVPLNSGRHHVVVKSVDGQKLKVSVDGAAPAEAGSASNRSCTPPSLYIFAAHSGGGTSYSDAATAKLYGLKMYDSNGILKRDFVPGIKDNVVGLYDRVSDMFYSSGSGTPLEAGPAIERSKPDAFVEYVESNGSQWVDTGVDGRAGVKSEADIDWISGAPLGVIGNSHCLLLQDLSGIGGQARGSGEVKTGVAVNSGRHLIVSEVGNDSEMTVTVDGTTSATSANNASGSTGVTIWMFAAHNYNNGGAWGAGRSKFYGLKLWQTGSDGICRLQRHFIPCVKDSRAGLYDAVSGVIFYSHSGTDLTASSTEVPLAVWRNEADDASLDNAANWCGDLQNATDAVVCAPWLTSVSSANGFAVSNLTVTGGNLAFADGTNTVAGTLTADGALAFTNLVINGSADCAVAISGFISGHGTVTSLTLDEGARFVPDGTDYLMITDALVGTMLIDMTDINLSGETGRFPLFKTGTVDILPAASSVEFVGGRPPSGRKLVTTKSGFGYDLNTNGFMILLR